MVRWLWTLALLALVIVLAVLAVAWFGDVMARWGTP